MPIVKVRRRLRDAGNRAPRRFTMMRDMMVDGHPPFTIARLTTTREDGEAPFDGSLWMRTTAALSCIDLYTDAVSYTRT